MADSDSALLDGLPRDWPDHSAPATQPAQPADPLLAQSQSPVHAEPSSESPPSALTEPSPTSTAFSNDAHSHDPPLVPSAQTDHLPPPPPPDVVSKPLPDTPQPEVESDPEFDHPTDLVADAAPAPPVSTKSVSELDDPGVKDLGWTNRAGRPPALIRGVPNDDLFTLVRRFNKQIQHVRAIPPPPPGFLDLEIADDEEFSPDKLRANLERLYMTVIVGMVAFGKHIARLRSWNEPRRTAYFCAAYFVSWYLSFLPALLVTTLLVLIFYPPARAKLFPPAPLAAISATSGNLQVPRAGVIGSPDSLSGAPEAHPGEAVEEEASHFVASLGAIGAGTVMGQGGSPKRKYGEAQGDVSRDTSGEMETEVGKTESDDSFAGALPDPSEAALRSKNAKDAANSNGIEDPGAQVAKKSVEGAMWEKMRPVMRVLADVADTWERLGNALEPVAPFPKYTARLRLAGVLLPLLVLSLTVSAELVVDGTTFLLGVVFFSQPILSKLTYKLTHRFPNWRRFLEIRRTLLRGVPTNAQLTITLLRIAEEAKAPLPPPPIALPHHTASLVHKANPAPAHPSDAVEELKTHAFAFDTDGYEIEGADGEHPPVYTDEGASEDGTYVEGSSTDKDSMEGDNEGGEKKKHGSKILGLVKKTTRAGVGGILSMDRLKAKVGNEHAKRRLGAVAARAEEDGAIAHSKAAAEEAAHNKGTVSEEKQLAAQRAEDALKREGPTSFSARLHGKKGRVLVVTSAASPCLSFVTEKPLRAALQAPSAVPGKGGDDSDGVKPSFTIGLKDIVALRKMGGFGWKGRLVVGWATGKDVLDGLEVVDRWGGRTVITAVKGRDELFNRLIAMGGQTWECL